MGLAAFGIARLILTTGDGDLIYHWAMDLQDTNGNGGNYNNIVPIVGGLGFTLLSADLQVGSADQYVTQTVAGIVVPTLTKSGTSSWGESRDSTPCSIPMPKTAPAPNAIIQFPSSGNLMVATFNSGDVWITAIANKFSPVPDLNRFDRTSLAKRRLLQTIAITLDMPPACRSLFSPL